MKSNLFKLNLKDLLRGAALAGISAIITALTLIIDNGDITTLFSWCTLQPILLTGISVFVSYLLKNILTNSKDKFLRRDS